MNSARPSSEETDQNNKPYFFIVCLIIDENFYFSDENHNRMEGHENRGYDDDEARDAAGPLPVPGGPAVDGSKRRKKSSFLSVDHTELNSHTYVYDANKSFEGMTVS